MRSRAYFSSDLKVSSGSADVTRADPRTSRSAVRRASRVVPSWSANTRSTCSMERYSSPISRASSSACSSPSRSSRLKVGSEPPRPRAKAPSVAPRSRATSEGSTARLRSKGGAMPSPWARIAASTWAGTTSAWPAAVAWVRAAWKASLVLFVHFSGSSVISCPLTASCHVGVVRPVRRAVVMLGATAGLGRWCRQRPLRGPPR